MIKVVFTCLIFVFLLVSSKMSEKTKCEVNYATCAEVPNENIHCEGHIIKYVNSKYNIDKLPMGKCYLATWNQLVGLFLKVIIQSLQRAILRIIFII